MQLVKVSTLPTACLGALLAVSVENCGESPAAVMPQKANQSKNQQRRSGKFQPPSMPHQQPKQVVEPKLDPIVKPQIVDDEDAFAKMFGMSDFGTTKLGQ